MGIIQNLTGAANTWLKAQTFSGGASVAGTLLSRQSVSIASTAGDLTITASQLIDGYFVDAATQTADFTLTTDTAANILAALPSALVGSSFKMRIMNADQSSTGYSATIAGGSGVTLSADIPSAPIPKGWLCEYLFVFDAVGASPALTVYPISFATQGAL